MNSQASLQQPIARQPISIEGIMSNVSNVSSSNYTSNISSVRSVKNDDYNDAAKLATKPETNNASKVVLGSSSKIENLSYDKQGKLENRTDLAALLAESDRKAQEIIDLIRPLVEQQGLNFAQVVRGEQKLQVDQKTIDEAKAAISEDGEFGIKKTAERILAFAKFAIADKPENFDKIQAAVERGFAEAKQILGGVLPEISEKTLQVVQEGLSRLRNELQSPEPHG